MPTYTYSCTTCSYTFEEIHSINNRNVPTFKECPNCGTKSVVKFVDTPPIADPHRMGRIKAPEGFRDVLRQIKKRNQGSTIEVD